MTWLFSQCSILVIFKERKRREHIKKRYPFFSHLCPLNDWFQFNALMLKVFEIQRYVSLPISNGIIAHTNAHAFVHKNYKLQTLSLYDYCAIRQKKTHIETGKWRGQKRMTSNNISFFFSRLHKVPFIVCIFLKFSLSKNSKTKCLRSGSTSIAHLPSP